MAGLTSYARYTPSITKIVLGVLTVSLPILALVPRDQAELALAAMITFLLVVLAVIDVLTSKVPNPLIYASIVFVLIATALIDLSLLDEAVIGGAASLGIMIVVAGLGRGLIGMGDVKVACLIGCALGWMLAVMAMTLGFMIGGMAAICLLLLGWKSRKDSVPFVPFFAAGTIPVLLIWGPLVSGLSRPFS